MPISNDDFSVQKKDLELFTVLDVYEIEGIRYRIIEVEADFPLDNRVGEYRIEEYRNNKWEHLKSSYEEEYETAEGARYGLLGLFRLEDDN